MGEGDFEVGASEENVSFNTDTSKDVQFLTAVLLSVYFVTLQMATCTVHVDVVEYSWGKCLFLLYTLYSVCACIVSTACTCTCNLCRACCCRFYLLYCIPVCTQ